MSDWFPDLPKQQEKTPNRLIKDRVKESRKRAAAKAKMDKTQPINIPGAEAKESESESEIELSEGDTPPEQRALFRGFAKHILPSIKKQQKKQTKIVQQGLKDLNTSVASIGNRVTVNEKKIAKLTDETTLNRKLISDTRENVARNKVKISEHENVMNENRNEIEGVKAELSKLSDKMSNIWDILDQFNSGALGTYTGEAVTEKDHYEAKKSFQKGKHSVGIFPVWKEHIEAIKATHQVNNDADAYRLCINKFLQLEMRFTADFIRNLEKHYVELIYNGADCLFIIFDDIDESGGRRILQDAKVLWEKQTGDSTKDPSIKRLEVPQYRDRVKALEMYATHLRWEWRRAHEEEHRRGARCRTRLEFALNNVYDYVLQVQYPGRKYENVEWPTDIRGPLPNIQWKVRNYMPADVIATYPKNINAITRTEAGPGRGIERASSNREVFPVNMVTLKDAHDFVPGMVDPGDGDLVTLNRAAGIEDLVASLGQRTLRRPVHPVSSTDSRATGFGHGGERIGSAADARALADRQRAAARDPERIREKKQREEEEKRQEEAEAAAKKAESPRAGIMSRIGSALLSVTGLGGASSMNSSPTRDTGASDGSGAGVAGASGGAGAGAAGAGATGPFTSEEDMDTDKTLSSSDNRALADLDRLNSEAISNLDMQMDALRTQHTEQELQRYEEDEKKREEEEARKRQEEEEERVRQENESRRQREVNNSEPRRGEKSKNDRNATVELWNDEQTDEQLAEAASTATQYQIPSQMSDFDFASQAGSETTPLSMAETIMARQNSRVRSLSTSSTQSTMDNFFPKSSSTLTPGHFETLSDSEGFHTPGQSPSGASPVLHRKLSFSKDAYKLVPVTPATVVKEKVKVIPAGSDKEVEVEVNKDMGKQKPLPKQKTVAQLAEDKLQEERKEKRREGLKGRFEISKQNSAKLNKALAKVSPPKTRSASMKRTNVDNASEENKAQRTQSPETDKQKAATEASVAPTDTAEETKQEDVTATSDNLSSLSVLEVNVARDKEEEVNSEPVTQSEEVNKSGTEYRDAVHTEENTEESTEESENLLSVSGDQTVILADGNTTWSTTDPTVAAPPQEGDEPLIEEAKEDDGIQHVPITRDPGYDDNGSPDKKSSPPPDATGHCVGVTGFKEKLVCNSEVTANFSVTKKFTKDFKEAFNVEDGAAGGSKKEQGDNAAESDSDLE